MNRRALLALAFTTTLPLMQATASPAEAEKRLKSAVDEVLAVADRVADRSQLAEKVRPTLFKYVSFDTMTRRAVGPGWRQFTPSQQEQATRHFTTLVIRTYSNKFTPGERPNIQYRAAVSPAAGRVDVPTSLVYKGSRYSVNYRLEQMNGQWLIADVVIEGVSMIANYRSQLDSQFKKGGAEAVIRSLEQSLHQPQ